MPNTLVGSMGKLQLLDQDTKFFKLFVFTTLVGSVEGKCRVLIVFEVN